MSLVQKKLPSLEYIPVSCIRITQTLATTPYPKYFHAFRSYHVHKFHKQFYTFLYKASHQPWSKVGCWVFSYIRISSSLYFVNYNYNPMTWKRSLTSWSPCNFLSFRRNFQYISYSPYGRTFSYLPCIKRTVSIISVLVLHSVLPNTCLMYRLKCSYELLSETDSISLLCMSSTLSLSKWNVQFYRLETRCSAIVPSNIPSIGFTLLSRLSCSISFYTNRILSPVTPSTITM